MSTIRIRGGRWSLTKFVLAFMTCGLSIPFVGLRRGGATNITGWPR